MYSLVGKDDYNVGGDRVYEAYNYDHICMHVFVCVIFKKVIYRLC